MVNYDIISVKRGELYLKLIEFDLSRTIREVEDPKLMLNSILLKKAVISLMLARIFYTVNWINIPSIFFRVHSTTLKHEAFHVVPSTSLTMLDQEELFLIKGIPTDFPLLDVIRQRAERCKNDKGYTEFTNF